MQSALTVEIARLKKLYQHPDLAITTSPRIEVTLIHEACSLITDEFGNCPYLRFTKMVKEEDSPFFNEAFTFDLSPASKQLPLAVKGGKAVAMDASTSAPISNIAHVVVRVFDMNTTPNSVVAVARSPGIVFNENGKGEAMLILKSTLDDESDTESRGQLTIRWTVKITLPEAPAVDVDADVEVDASLVLTGDVNLAAADRQNIWFHIANNASWRERCWKAVAAAYPSEKATSKAASGRAQRGSIAPQPSDAEKVSPMVAVVKDRWKCKRLHQVFTKYRLAALRQMSGASLTWTPEEELEMKHLWAEMAYLRKTALVSASKKIRDSLERHWVLYLTGELPSDSPGATLTFDQRTKMSTAVFGKTQYEGFIAALIEGVDPNLAGSPVVALIAKETFEADPNASGSRAWKAAQETKKKADEEAARAAQPSSEPTSPVKARPGEAQFELFKSLVCYYCDWWAETLTEVEYCAVLASLQPVILNAKDKGEGKPMEVSANASKRGGSSTRRRTVTA